MLGHKLQFRLYRPKYKRPDSMDCSDRGSHARGVYLTQDTSRMRTERVKQEEVASGRNNMEKIVLKNM